MPCSPSRPRAPLAGEHSFWRGASLLHYDEETRRTIAELGDLVEGARATALWDEALAATWTGEPVWFHGDIASWTFLPEDARPVFRRDLDSDDAMWARGRAWTLWKALITWHTWGREVAERILAER